MDILSFNKNAWNKEVEKGNKWTLPVSTAEIAKARSGDFEILLTPVKPVPKDWFPPLPGCRVLCLASGGGQQGPLLSAAGAQVTVLDNSPLQLAQDQLVAERENLDMLLVEGDMADLSIFIDNSFDFIINPVSTCFIPAVRPVWKESFRVLSHGGTLITGFCNPVEFCFDEELAEQGIYQVRHTLPYSDLTSITTAEREKLFGADAPIEFGHTLEDQIGGQLDAGFHLIGFYEDRWPDRMIAKFMATFIATKAIKLS